MSTDSPVLTPGHARLTRTGAPALLVLGLAIGVGMAVWGDSWWRAAGPCWVGAAVAFGWALYGPRRGRLVASDAPPAAQVVLPRRPGHVVALGLGCLFAAGACQFMSLAGFTTGEGSGRRAVLLAFFTPFLVVAGVWLLLARARGRGLVRLSRTSLTYEALLGRARVVLWSDIDAVRLDPALKNGLFLHGRDGGVTPITIAGQGVAPDALADALARLASSPRERAGLESGEWLEALLSSG